MADTLSPGVFIEEIPSQTQIIDAVSTSAVGAVGYSPKGPTDRATRVSSWDDYVRKFGSFDKNSFLPLSMAAFFQNGGKFGYVVRVTPSDAVAADAKVQSVHTDQKMNIGDGATAAVTQLVLTPNPFSVNSGNTPLVPTKATFRWRGAGNAVAAGTLKKRDGTTNMMGDGATLKFDGRIDPTLLPTTDPSLFSVVPKLSGDANPTTLKWTVGTNPTTMLLTYANVGAMTTTVVIGTTMAGSTAIFDHRTGIISILFNVAEVPDNATAIQLGYTPATATKSVTDDGAGGLPAGAVLTGAGTINYTTGAYSFTTVMSAIPHKGCPVLCTYSIYAWNLDPISKGDWANKVRVEIGGSQDYYTTATAQFSRWNVNVTEYNSASGQYEIVETYQDMSLSDATSSKFWADVINAVSEYVNIQEPGSPYEAPLQLQGISRTYALAGGDETAGGQTYTGTLGNAPLAVRTLTITYTAADGTSKTIKDDGNGALTGDIDATGTNTINYTTGQIALKTVATIKAGTLLVATFYSSAAETKHIEMFGDSTKSYTAGANGTFSSGNYGRNQISVLSLAAATQTLGNGQTLKGKGLYALTQVEDLMQVIVPDFAGDVTITGDILDYVDSRAMLPSGGDRFAILTVPKGSTDQQAVDWLRFSLARSSNFAALYWPWIKVADPLSDNRDLTVPPLGHVAGIYARVDATRNVGKAPAGVIDGALKFLTGLETKPTQEQCDLVYPAKINPLKDSLQTGRCVWGARTISANTTDWRYINVRRLFMFLERSIFNSTHWIVFENNGPALWTRIKTQLIGFFRPLFDEGYFAGTSPDTSYRITVDETNNPQLTIDRGQVIIDILIAANKPAEFVRFRVAQSNNLASS